MFHQLLEKMARRIQPHTAEVSRLFPGRLWRIYGPEYASESYLRPRLFDEYVVRYVAPMIHETHAHGGYARIRCHGRQLVLFGNLEIADIEMLPLPGFRCW